MTTAGVGLARRARSGAAAIVVVGLVLAFAGVPAGASGGRRAVRRAATGQGEIRPGTMVPITLGPSLAAPTSVPDSLAGLDDHAAELTAQDTLAPIVVQYDGGFNANPAAKAAFQAAVNVWRKRLSSPVPIVVNASFTPLGSGVLGAAGPEAFVRDIPGLPVATTWYPIALANAITRTDLDPDDADIHATFSSSFPAFYFGTDGHPGAGQADFESVVMHELGHGLGFFGSMSVSNGSGSFGFGTPYPIIFDRFTRTNGVPLLSTAPGASLAAALQGKTTTFDGNNATAGNNGAAPRLYTPASWESGSSYSHLDEVKYPAGNRNSLMTPSISPGESIHDPGPVTLGIFKDIGWGLANLPRVSVGGAAISEGTAGSRPLTFTISLSSPAVLPVTVAYRTVPTTATPGTDYGSKSGTATVPAGATSVAVAIAVRGDTVVEPSEMFSVKISAPTYATVQRATGTGTILNDDPSAGRKIAVGNASITEGNTGNRALRFTVALSQVASTPVSVHWATAPGTATATTDYVTASGTLTIPAGTLSLPVSVIVRGDVAKEPNETMTVRLTAPSGATIGRATGAGTIITDD